MKSTLVIASILCVIALNACLAQGSGLYDGGSDVVELTAANFQNKVINSDDLWLVEFYAPWCGHCKSLAPEWSKAASALKGMVKVGAVNMDEHQSVGAPYDIKGFPTIKFFGSNKNSPADYQSARTAQAITDFALQQAKSVVSSRLNGGSSGSKKSSSSGSGSGSGSDSGKKAVIELTDSNFDELVLQSNDLWLIEFFAPWCGHCKNLAPTWESAAKELQGKVKVGALDATVHTAIAGRYHIQGYPTIKIFGARKDAPEDYQGGRSQSDIVSAALSRLDDLTPPPKPTELISQKVWDTTCSDKQLCIVAFLPDVLDSTAAGRNKYIETLQESATKFKSRGWGYVWVEAGRQPELEQLLGVGGSGYPAVVAVSTKKSRFVQHIGALNTSSLNGFLNRLSSNKEKTVPYSTLPNLATLQPWDGKDREFPNEEL